MAGTPGVYQGVGSIGDNTQPVGDNNNPLQGLDVDIIAVALKTGDILQVDVDAANPDVAGSFTSALDSIVRIFDQAGTNLALSDNNAAPFDLQQVPFLDSYVRFTAPADGTYYVGISGSGNAAYDPNAANSGQLGPLLAAGPYQVEIRVNNAVATVPPGTVPIGFGTFETPQAIADRIIAAINGVRARALGLNVVAKRTATENLIELAGANMRVDRVKYASTPEENDSLESAIQTGIQLGQDRTYRAVGQIGDNQALDPTVDVDLFELPLHAGEVLQVSTTTAAIYSSLVPALRVFDAGGTELAAAVPGLLPEPMILLRAPTTGAYYVGVSSTGNLGYNANRPGSGTSGSTGDYELEIQVGAGQVGIQGETIGDKNLFRDQGQILISSNVIRDVLEYGVVTDASVRNAGTNRPHPGSVRNLQELNTSNLAHGVTISNNLIARPGLGGIHVSGDPNPVDTSVAAVPFARVMNNTIFGEGGEMFPDVRTLKDRFGDPVELEPRFDDVGILVTENASPTLLNNIVANVDTGIRVDTSSASTVIGGTVFQGNTTNSNTAVGVGSGSFPLLLGISDTLFVDPAEGNFYLAEGSRAIDSSVDSLDDRPGLITVKGAVGIPVSPILVPDRDVTGQLRVDDPNVDTPAGLGENVFKDRGAVDRADFVGPTAQLSDPSDNDATGTDKDPRETVVQTFQTLSLFSIKLADGADSAASANGVGADDSTVTADKVLVTQDGVPLQVGVDYTFSYDRTNNIIRLTPLSGIWLPEKDYQITLDNSEANGIRDLADNLLNPNQENGQTTFTVSIGRGIDYGDAPDPTYPTLAANGGASHVIMEGFFLGTGVDPELDGQPTTDASGDGADEDGVVFQTSLVRNVETILSISASDEGLLDAWIDLNADGDWNDPVEQVLASRALAAGANSLSVRIPKTAVAGDTLARFRFSRTGGLSPGGAAEVGEVEDYRVTIYTNPWHNPVNALDVNDRDGVSPLDALLIINELNRPAYRDPATGRLPVPPPAEPPLPYFDVNDDGFVAPLDALLVINRLGVAPARRAASFAAMRPRTAFPATRRATRPSWPWCRRWARASSSVAPSRPTSRHWAGRR